MPGKSKGLDRATGKFALWYLTAILFVLLTAADGYLIRVAPSLLAARLGAYSGFLGLSTIFVAVLFADAQRTGGVRVLRLYRAVRYVILPFLFLTVLALVYGFHPTAYPGENGELLFLPLYNFLILFLAVSAARVPGALAYHRRIFALSFFGLASAVFFDLFSLGEFSGVPGRAAGFAENPNIAAGLLIALAICSVDWTEQRLLDLPVWLVAGAGVFVTFSRAGIVLYAFALGAYLVLCVLPRIGAVLKMTVLTGLLFLLIGISFPQISEFFGRNEMLAEYTAQQRLAEFSELAEGDFDTVSDDTRVQLVRKHMDLIDESPLLGYGTAFTLRDHLGPHNLYLNQWVNNGILGLATLLVFLLSSFLYFQRHGDVKGMVFVGMFALMGFFSHTLLDSRAFLTMFGFLGALAYLRRPCTIMHTAEGRRRLRS
jgi:O-antigen ligase